MTDYTNLVEALRGCKDIEFCTECPRMGNGFTEYCNIKDDAADAIEALQAELPKRGEWIMDGRYTRHCSICNESVAWPEKYCPNCGAKMEVQDESVF